MFIWKGPPGIQGKAISKSGSGKGLVGTCFARPALGESWFDSSGELRTSVEQQSKNQDESKSEK